MDEFTKKQRQVQLPLNLLRKEKRQRGLIEGAIADDELALAAEGWELRRARWRRLTQASCGTSLASGGPIKAKCGMGDQPATGGKSRQVHEAQVAIGAAPTKAHSKEKQLATGSKQRDEPAVGMSDTTLQNRANRKRGF